MKFEIVTCPSGVVSKHGLLTPNEAFFHGNPELLRLDRQIGQINWTDKFYGTWGIFGQTISTHFGFLVDLKALY